MNIPYAFKKCTKCGKWLVANSFNFGKTKKGKWGLKSQCKECGRKYYNKYYDNNKEYEKERSKQWRENNKEYFKEYREDNKEYFKEYNKQYYEDNKEYIKERNKQWYEDNKEYYKQYYKDNKERNKQHYEDNKEYYKRYYEDNKDKILEYNKQWHKNNPEKVFNKHNRRRSKLENQGRGINKEQYKECNEWFDWKCAYSGEKMESNNSTNGRTLDHIVALDNGGLNEPWNCIPMKKGYNTSKHITENVLNWYLEQEYFDIERLNKIVEWQVYAYEKWDGEEFGELILITDLFEDK